MQNHSINDAYEDGFENGIQFAVGYLCDTEQVKKDDRRIIRLANFLELKKPWKNLSGWYEMIMKCFK